MDFCLQFTKKYRMISKVNLHRSGCAEVPGSGTRLHRKRGQENPAGAAKSAPVLEGKFGYPFGDSRPLKDAGKTR